MRIDKWLWAVRLYRTRGLASAACRQGWVIIGGRPVKPSREVKLEELILIRTGQIKRTVKVLGFLEQRVGAQAAKEFVQDLTPASEYEKPREPALKPLFLRPKGAGRPTKRERRLLQSYFGDES